MNHPSRAMVTSTARSLVTLGPARADLVPAVRVTLSLAVPVALLLVTDRIEWSLFASFGAFSSLYGRYTTPRTRVRQQLCVGVMLSLCVGLGGVIAQFGAGWSGAVHAWVTVLAGTLVAAGSATFVSVRGLQPAGAVFPVFATTAVASTPVGVPAWLALAIAAASATWCVLLGVLSRWVGEANADARDVPPAFVPVADRRREFLRYGTAALVGGSVATLTGIPSPYWAQVAAVVPLSAPRRLQQVERGLHRIVGTVLGVAVAAFLLSFPSQPWQVVVWVVLMQFLAELFVLRNYSLALVFITPLALLMVYLAHPQPVGQLLAARVAETVIGVTVGIVVVLCAVALTRWRTARLAG
ncbi:FUSC family protein [Corynebacterium kalidii]|uniref:FUSC family protein n=1 Tax=Corynebacterium kalidii TaxID=2931982 RepID=A0A9X1WJD7_9CORY|nr:FUSC family protein [Corynebacterium kalidii]